MTVYEMKVEKTLRVYSLGHSDMVEIHLKTNNKQALDYFNNIIINLLSDEHYLDYLKEEEGE